MRLFLDANILFLAGYSKTSPVHDLLSLAGAGDCELVSSEYAFEEARRNLELKVDASAVTAMIAATRMVVRVNEAAAPAVHIAQTTALSDRADIPILAAAIQSAVDALVTGDRRAFGDYFGSRLAGIRIMRLRDALNEILAAE